MSTDDEKSSHLMCCASCGIAGVDDVKLKDCDDGCGLVKYCSDKCQNNRREQHEEECIKRKAELRNRDLFEQPESSHLEECPICCLPLSLDETKSRLMTCCSKLICIGCHYANSKREYETGLEHRCAFCREPLSKSQEEHDKNRMKRVKKNDPVAMRVMGEKRRLEGDYDGAVEYWTTAAELGDKEAHYALSVMYGNGLGVEKDVEKEVYHLEEAAIGGHPEARYNLGVLERNIGRFERAKKHFIIAANIGYNDSLKLLRKLYADGHASKDDYADALRAYQTVMNEAKSAEREEAEAYFKQVAGSRKSG